MRHSTDELIARFDAWLNDAKADPTIVEPTAMTLATVDAHGQPSARVVLLKAYDTRGFVFYTNFTSRKGKELLGSQKAALCFWWGALERQVRIEGSVEKVSDAEADAYFALRPRISQLGTWASRQSQPLISMDALQAEVERVDAQYADREVPRPPHWSGFRVVPHAIEFWQQGPYRLHQRERFERDGDVWTGGLLNP